ncbi:MAG: SDR family NAD(P)-dependent oxidoreductase [Proteobacteria bacterium]|nr:SDR family NAD(P)-dependent oxidoreductase [Pseudomonadota bacterium]NDC23756.1 SDR family NAD(P)-dependent oxidoreductase [Pseudomonadota bacterium]
MILITGATSGIGKASAELLARNHKNLFLVGRRGERLEKIKTELEKKHPISVEISELDVSSKQEVEDFAKKHSTQLQQVEALINNAGLAMGRDLIHEGKTDDWDKMIDVNLKGLLYVTHEVLPFFVKKKSGHVVNVGSVAGRWIYPRGNIYCATKAAVAALTQSLRQDLLGTGIRVTEISPGMVETEFSLVRFSGDETKAKAIYEGMKPLSAQDIAEAIVWCLMRPAHVNIQEVVIYPTQQASTSLVHRNSNS